MESIGLNGRIFYICIIEKLYLIFIEFSPLNYGTISLVYIYIMKTHNEICKQSKIKWYTDKNVVLITFHHKNIFFVFKNRKVSMINFYLNIKKS